jgi:hypothetical protein
VCDTFFVEAEVNSLKRTKCTQVNRGSFESFASAVLSLIIFLRPETEVVYTGSGSVPIHPRHLTSSRKTVFLLVASETQQVKKRGLTTAQNFSQYS